MQLHGVGQGSGKLLRMIAPQQRHQRQRPLIQRLEDRLQDWRPSQLLVRAGIARGHREHLVQQQDSLGQPGTQIRMRDRIQTEIGLQLLVDIGQGTRQRADLLIRREGQAVGVAGRRIGVLANN